MKGYKGMDPFMRCKGFQYEVGMKYRVSGDVKLCKNGFHFCEVLRDVFDFYEKDDTNRFFEVEASGKLESDGTKTAAEEIAIIRELGEIEINRAFYGDGDGYGDGYGDGNGDGDGYGYGYGYGNGYGYGKNSQKVLILT